METGRLPVFQERFKTLRGDKTQGQFAEQLGISRPTVGLYESGARIPDAEILRDISAKCCVSADWLLGLTEHPSTNPDIQMICGTTGLCEKSILTLQSTIVAPNDRDTIQASEVIDYLLSDFSFLEEVVGGINDALQVMVPTKRTPEIDQCLKTAGEHGYALLTPYEAKDFFLSQVLDTLKVMFTEMLDSFSREVSDYGEHQED